MLSKAELTLDDVTARAFVLEIETLHQADQLMASAEVLGTPSCQKFKGILPLLLPTFN